MNNLDIARVLYEIADLLEFKGDDLFKVRAYRKAAEAVGRCTVNRWRMLILAS